MSTATLNRAWRGVDVGLWQIARARRRPFDGSRALITRDRSLEHIDVATGTGALDADFDAVLPRAAEREYLIEIAPGTIEPRYGFCHLGPARVVWESLNPKCARWPTARASVSSLLRARGPGARFRVEHLPSAVSLRDFNEGNFWHAFNDLYPKLLLAREGGIADDVPAVIGSAFARAPYFDLVAPVFRSLRPLVVQGDSSFVECDRVFCGVTMNFDPAPLDDFLDAFATHDPIGWPADHADRAVFITRHPTRARAVTNLDAVHARCARLGIEVVDFDEIDPAAAVELVRGTTTVLGLHGAGLTNMMFRRGLPTRVGEIVMDGWIDPTYLIMARHFGFRYRGTLAHRDGVDRFNRPTFRVDADEFERFAAGLLAAAPTAR